MHWLMYCKYRVSTRRRKTIHSLIPVDWLIFGTKVKREEKQKLPCPHLHAIVLRCLAWGFSSSGVERTFSRGNWIRGRREVTVELANDELRATHFTGDKDEFPSCNVFFEETNVYKNVLKEPLLDTLHT